MKSPSNILVLMAFTLMLSACGAYVGSPPKNEVHETTTTEQPPAVVHVYTP